MKHLETFRGKHIHWFLTSTDALVLQILVTHGRDPAELGQGCCWSWAGAEVQQHNAASWKLNCIVLANSSVLLVII